MICPACKKDIKDNSLFCAKCGSKIPRCPTCGKLIVKKNRFCVYDGTPLSEDLLSLIPEEPAAVDISAEIEPLKMEKHFCVQCGKVNTDGQRVCESCRKSSAANTISERNDVQKKKKVSAVPVLIGMIALLAVLLIGCFAYIMLRNDFPPNPGKESVSQSVSESSEKVMDDAEKNDEKKNEEALDPEIVVDENPAVTPPVELPENFVSKEPIDDQELDPVLYFIVNSDQMYLTRKDLDGFNQEMCRIARNGIYARMGRKFQSADLVDYFMQFAWYTPMIEPEDFTEDMLNAYQLANRDLIVDYETEQGYR